MALKIDPLSLQFRRAAGSAASILGDMSGRFPDSAKFDVSNIPSVEREEWTRMGGVNNCYNYALNMTSQNYTHGTTPGDLAIKRTGNCNLAYRHMMEIAKCSSDEEKFAEYVEVYKKYMRLDGHRDIGASFSLKEGFMPVALFFKPSDENDENSSHDFHFYALRRRRESGSTLVWAHKPGDFAVQTCSDGPDSLFHDAMKRGYHTFGGFWLVKNPQLSHK